MTGYVYNGTTLKSVPSGITQCIIEPNVESLGGSFSINAQNTIREVIFLKPSNLKTIYGYAFSGIIHLETIDFSNCTKLTDIYSHIFMHCLNLKQVIFPDSVTFFDTHVFRNTTLSSFKIPSNLDRTGFGSFQSLSTLTNVDFSNAKSLRHIWEGGFRNCTSLRTIDLRNCLNLRIIGNNAFEYCDSLVSVLLPKQFNQINFGQNAFLACTSLTTLFDDDTFRIFNFPLLAFTNCSKLQIQALFGSIPTCISITSSTMNYLILPAIFI